MRDTDYTYAVARIRSNELSLLTKADISQLIAADSYDTVLRTLTDKGWSDNGEMDICENELQKAWNLICESVEDSALSEALIVKNDFSNLKAAIKAFFSSTEADGYMTRPCLVEPDALIKAVKEKDFESLPGYLGECAEEAYHTVAGGGSGQAAELIIDKAALKTAYEFAIKSGSSLLQKITELACVVSDIKIALRSFRNGKNIDFAVDAMCPCGKLDVKLLAEKAFSDEKLAPVLEEAGYMEISEYADGDFSSLEMAADNLVTSWLNASRYEVYGPDPLVGYYYAKTAEIKNARIILSAKAASVPNDIIQQRVRETYV